MSKFIISKSYTQTYSTIIEANNEEEALRIAKKEGLTLDWKDWGNCVEDLFYQSEGKA